MPELIAKSALEGYDKTIGTVRLREVEVGPITSVAVFPSGADAVAKGLGELGLAFPGPNETRASNGVRIVWTGRDQAFVLGAVPDLAGAAVSDQSDGWACLGLTGAKSVDVLMRLVPLDLRLGAFPVGRAVRAPLNHMNMVLMRVEDGFNLLVFRSMARTAVHEIADAMTTVAARG